MVVFYAMYRSIHVFHLLASAVHAITFSALIRKHLVFSFSNAKNVTLKLAVFLTIDAHAMPVGRITTVTIL